MSLSWEEKKGGNFIEWRAIQFKRHVSLSPPTPSINPTPSSFVSKLVKPLSVTRFNHFDLRRFVWEAVEEASDELDLALMNAGVSVDDKEYRERDDEAFELKRDGLLRASKNTVWVGKTQNYLDADRSLLNFIQKLTNLRHLDLNQLLSTEKHPLKSAAWTDLDLDLFMGALEKLTG